MSHRDTRCPADRVEAIPAPSNPKEHPMSDLVATAHRIHELFCQDRLSEVLELCAPDVEAELVPAGSVASGREGFLGFMKLFKDAFPDIDIRWENHVAGDGQVAAACRWTGTHTGPLNTPMGTVPPTGRRVENGRFVEIFSFDDGRLVRLANYQDLGNLLREIGVA